MQHLIKKGTGINKNKWGQGLDTSKPIICPASISTSFLSVGLFICYYSFFFPSLNEIWSLTEVYNPSIPCPKYKKRSGSPILSLKFSIKERLKWPRLEHISCKNPCGEGPGSHQAQAAWLYHHPRVSANTVH